MKKVTIFYHDFDIFFEGENIKFSTNRPVHTYNITKLQMKIAFEDLSR